MFDHMMTGHAMNKLFALLALCKGNLWGTCGLPSQRASSVEVGFLSCLSEQVIEHTADVSMQRALTLV